VGNRQNLRDVRWSPTGDSLLVHDEDQDTFLYLSDGRIFDYYDYKVTWQPNGSNLRSSSLIWSKDNSAAASIVFIETPSTESDPTVMERMVQIDSYEGNDKGRRLWLIEDPNFRYDVIALLDWVPQTDWLLLGYGHGSIASQIATGYRLAALNVRSGEIVDSGLSIPIDAQIDWHPSETGLLVTTDLRGSDVGGMGKLVLWQVLENRVNYPLVSEQYVQSPVWSPDGRYIAYSSLNLPENFQLHILDTETGIARMQVENGTWPAWSRDGSMLFYLEMIPGSELAQIRAIGWDQDESLIVALGLFPRCPGLCQPRTVFDYTP
jgi:WD40-like Beta Propeller Repeat